MAAQNLDHVGQVVLALGVLVAHLADVLGKKGAVKGIAAGVALKEAGGLLGRAVLLLDDARDGAVLGKLDAAIAKRVGRRHGEDGSRVLAAGDALGKGADGLGLNERQVAVENHDGALADAGSLDGHASSVGGAQALGLLDALHVSLRGQVGADLLGAVAHDDHDAVRTGDARGTRDPADQRPVEQLVHYFGVTGLHTRSLAGSEDDRGHCHGL